MELDRQQIIRKVASFIYATAVLEQGDNDYFVSFDTIDNEMENNEVNLPPNWRNDIEFLKDIQDELSNYPGCKDNSDACWIQKAGYDEYGDKSERELEPDNEGFSLCLFTDYIAWNVTTV